MRLSSLFRLKLPQESHRKCFHLPVQALHAQSAIRDYLSEALREHFHQQLLQSPFERKNILHEKVVFQPGHLSEPAPPQGPPPCRFLPSAWQLFPTVQMKTSSVDRG